MSINKNMHKLYNPTQAQRVKMGGPDTSLPIWLESLLSWILAMACLGVALWHWLQQCMGQRWNILRPNKDSYMPLMTHSKYEFTNASALDRYRQLTELLDTFVQEKRGTSPNAETPTHYRDDDIVELVQQDSIARRLTSLVVLKRTELPPFGFDLLDQLQRIWPRLTELPPNCSPKPHFKISLIVPVYKEDGTEVLQQLQHTHDMAADPSTIELILVHAGHCTDWDRVVATTSQSKSADYAMQFGRHVCTTTATRSAGRGPTLNHGAALATGGILTFLHADTRLPHDWDIAIRAALQEHKVHACAFGFAIDTSSKGLKSASIPPGIRAIEATANWRTHLFQLPYGDQCLSLTKHAFHYFGGYPHQSIMEDYELVHLLRHRIQLGEKLAILPCKAHCGPRRWQTYGVLYVTYTNSQIVNLYARGDITPDDLFQLYYGSTSKKSTDTRSPWEVKLQERLVKPL